MSSNYPPGVTGNEREIIGSSNECDDCDSEITLTLESYGNGQLMRIDCPKCGVKYDTNLDPIEGEDK